VENIEATERYLENIKEKKRRKGRMK